MTPFPRTTCACADCVDCCKEQPASLVPGELEAIAERLGVTLEEAKANFVASPGALVMDSTTGRQFRIGTITPKMVGRGKDRRCVFLDEQDRCRIHGVAPAGCAIFDTHMGRAEAARRSAWVARAQMDEGYQALRRELPFADSYKPRRV